MVSHVNKTISEAIFRKLFSLSLIIRPCQFFTSGQSEHWLFLCLLNHYCSLDFWDWELQLMINCQTESCSKLQPPSRAAECCCTLCFWPHGNILYVWRYIIYNVWRYIIDSTWYLVNFVSNQLELLGRHARASAPARAYIWQGAEIESVSINGIL